MFIKASTTGREFQLNEADILKAIGEEAGLKVTKKGITWSKTVKWTVIEDLQSMMGEVVFGEVEKSQKFKLDQARIFEKVLDYLRKDFRIKTNIELSAGEGLQIIGKCGLN